MIVDDIAQTDILRGNPGNLYRVRVKGDNFGMIGGTEEQQAIRRLLGDFGGPGLLPERRVSDDGHTLHCAAKPTRRLSTPPATL